MSVILMRKWYFDLLTKDGDYLFFYLAITRVGPFCVGKLQWNFCGKDGSYTTADLDIDSARIEGKRIDCRYGYVDLTKPSITIRIDSPKLNIDLTYQTPLTPDFSDGCYRLAIGKRGSAKWYPVALKSIVNGSTSCADITHPATDATGYIDYVTADAALAYPLTKSLYWARIHTEDIDITFTYSDLAGCPEPSCRLIVRLKDRVFESESFVIRDGETRRIVSLGINAPESYTIECEAAEWSLRLTVRHIQSALESDFVRQMKLKGRILPRLIRRFARIPRSVKYFSEAQAVMTVQSVETRFEGAQCIGEYVRFE